MIISQTIRNGLCIVNKTGSYFQLISASGIVNVTLNLAGRTVLNSKMWVGMNLDKAMPYDEIVITAEQDGAIEFWAGDVSMQLFAFSNDAAKAVRTSLVYAEGATLLTDPDYLRKELRIRPSRNISIGGAGLQTWQAKAGETLSLPIAGSVYGFAAIQDIEITDYLASTEVSALPDQFYTQFANWSADGLYAICTRSGVQQNVNGAGWELHPQFPSPEGNDYRAVRMYNGDIFVFVIPNTAFSLKVYKSTDEGRTFSHVFTINRPTNYQLGGGGRLLYCCGKYLTLNSTTHYIVVDSETGFYTVINVPVAGAQRQFYAKNMTKWYRSTGNYGEFQTTDDAGKTWRTLLPNTAMDGSTPEFSPIGHIAVKDMSTSKYTFSEDGEKFVGAESCDVTPWYFGAGRWIIVKSSKLYLVHIENGELVKELICSSFQALDSLWSVSVTGIIRNSTQADMNKIEPTVSGTLLPTAVEVMELLA